VQKPGEENEYPPVKEEFARLYDRLNGKDSTLNLSGTIRLYDSETPNSIKETTPFSFTRSGSSFVSLLGSMQTMSNGHVFIQLDTTNRYLMVSPIDENALSSSAKAVMPFDALFSDTATFRMSGKVGGSATERFIELTSDFSPEIKSMTIYYDPANYMITHAELQWWKNNMIPNNAKEPDTWITKIQYSYPLFIGLDIEDKISDIITINKNTVEPAAPYRDYRFNSRL
jgi:hypothetical protein